MDSEGVQSGTWIAAGGMLAVPWTVNDLEDMRWLKDIGVNELISDRPDALLTLPWFDGSPAHYPHRVTGRNHSWRKPTTHGPTATIHGDFQPFMSSLSASPVTIGPVGRAEAPVRDRTLNRMVAALYWPL